MAKAKHDWAKLDPRIDHLKAQGWTDTQIAKDLSIGRQTLVAQFIAVCRRVKAW
jgi:hypothetical protein